MRRRLLKQVLLFGALYYLVYLALDALIYLLSHIPPSAMNLDPVILALFNVEHILAAPGLLLRHLWPGETTPGFWKILATLFSCLAWGLLMAGLKNLWTKIRT